MKDIRKTIYLRCDVCANDQFIIGNDSFDDIQSAPIHVEVECSDCGKVLTKEELIESNQYNINANVDEFKKEVVKEVEKQMKKMFKKNKF